MFRQMVSTNLLSLKRREIAKHDISLQIGKWTDTSVILITK